MPLSAYIQEPSFSLFLESIKKKLGNAFLLFSSAVNIAKEKNEELAVVSCPDTEDINAARNGDEDAFTRIVKRYENRIMAQMWRFARNPATAEELVQDVFVEAYKSLHNYRAEAPFLHWLGRIASRVGYRYLKKLSRTRPTQELEDWHLWKDAKEEERKTRAAEWVHELLSRLNPEEQLVLTLHYFEECDMQEIARRMEWTRDTVKMRAYRARQKLKEMIEAGGLMEELKWIL